MLKTKLIIYGIIFLILAGVVGYFGFNFYNQFYGIPSNSPKGEYLLILNKNDTLDSAMRKLETDKVIYSADSTLLLEKTEPISGVVPGTYHLQLPAAPKEILTQMNSEILRIIKEAAEATKRETVKITFQEGLTADQVFQKLHDNGVAKLEDLQKSARDPKAFDTVTYPFLPKPLTCTYGDLSTCAKYYIEGYLYPDTYEFYKPSSLDEIYPTFLDNFSLKVWSKVKKQVETQKADFQSVITMASVIEKETGRTRRGVTEQTRDEVNKERALVASVFYNRLENDMRWESNVTVNYGLNRQLCEQTIKIDNCVLLDDPLTDTKYNTYRVVGYPIAPVTTPQFDAVNAALTPESSDYLFFVADNTGKTYFGKTEFEHQRNIQKVHEVNAQLGT